MPTFQDNAGRTWPIEINVAAIKRVRALLNVDLLSVLDEGASLLARLYDDPVLLVDVLYVLCQPLAEERQVSDEEFGRSMSGDALEQGARGLLEGLSDFFPSARQRAALKELLQKTELVAQRVMEHAQQEVDRLDPDSLAQSVIASYGNSPGSSASTPDPEH